MGEYEREMDSVSRVEHSKEKLIKQFLSSLSRRVLLLLLTQVAKRGAHS